MVVDLKEQIFCAVVLIDKRRVSTYPNLDPLIIRCPLLFSKSDHIVVQSGHKTMRVAAHCSII